MIFSKPNVQKTRCYIEIRNLCNSNLLNSGIVKKNEYYPPNSDEAKVDIEVTLNLKIIEKKTSKHLNFHCKAVARIPKIRLYSLTDFQTRDGPQSMASKKLLGRSNPIWKKDEVSFSCGTL